VAVLQRAVPILHASKLRTITTRFSINNRLANVLAVTSSVSIQKKVAAGSTSAARRRRTMSAVLDDRDTASGVLPQQFLTILQFFAY
jgi:hypothetical protein